MIKIVKEPYIWSYLIKGDFTDNYYQFLVLHHDFVVSTWFALHRQDGKELWQKTFSKLNAIFGISGNIILGYEFRLGTWGPWDAGSMCGCYAISVKSGELLWRWDGAGFWGKVNRLLDYIPGLSNTFKPEILGYNETFCAVSGGQLLDISTGLVSSENIETKALLSSCFPQMSDTTRVNNTILLKNGRVLSYAIDVLPETTEGTEVRINYTVDDCFSWGVHLLGLRAEYGCFGWRLFQDKLFCIGSEELALKPVRVGSRYSKAHPTYFHLVVFDCLAGQLVQTIRLNERRCTRCRFEAIDERGLLISLENEVFYFAFISPNDLTSQPLAAAVPKSR